MKKKVMLGMSGGVDSSVAAALLLEQGFDVVGVTLKLRPDEYMKESASGGCCSLDDISDAKRVAAALSIPHYVLAMTDVFKEAVIDNFVAEYGRGRTPNPCIACNRFVKFGAMLERAVAMGMDYIATGHYAVIERTDGGRYTLRRSAGGKDQSYALYTMSQHELKHTLFPLGDRDKAQVRAIAEKLSLPVAHKPDSQEICFVADNDYAGFIERYTGQTPPTGDFVDRAGQVLGRHRGITHYTVGQRKGLGVAFGKPMYVTALDAPRNRIILGEEGSQYAAALEADDVNWIAADSLREGRAALIKVRYQAAPVPGRLELLDGGRVAVLFDAPQRAVTPGQAVVFYDGDYVLGGGTIAQSTPV